MGNLKTALVRKIVERVVTPDTVAKVASAVQKSGVPKRLATNAASVGAAAAKKMPGPLKEASARALEQGDKFIPAAAREKVVGSAAEILKPQNFQVLEAWLKRVEPASYLLGPQGTAGFLAIQKGVQFGAKHGTSTENLAAEIIKASVKTK